jgi:DNA-3-methyladenine glycosylase II
MSDDAIAHLQRCDPIMSRIVTSVGTCGLAAELKGSAFSALLEAIVYQQITGKAAESILRRLRLLVGRRWPRPQDIQAHSDEALRGAGLSRQKIGYLRDLAAKAPGLPARRLVRADDEAVVEALIEVKGIGRWTAEMFLMFRLGRPDVLPVGDYGIRKAAQRAYRLRELPKPERLRRLAEPWRPYRSAACWYLWRSLDARLMKTPEP